MTSQRRVLATRIREERQIASGAEQLLDAWHAADDRERLLLSLASELGLRCAILESSHAGAVRFLEPDGPSSSAGAAGGCRALASPAIRFRGRQPRAWRVECDRASSRVRTDQRVLVTSLPGTPTPAALLVMASGRELNRVDLRLTRQAATLLSVQLELRRERADGRTSLRAALVRDAVFGTRDPRALRDSAASLGVDLGRTECCVRHQIGQSPVGHGAQLTELVSRGVARLGLDRLALLAGSNRGVVVLASLDTAVPRHVAAAAVRAQLGELFADWDVGPAPLGDCVLGLCAPGGAAARSC